ncbi:hypothetical protein OAI24_02220 [Alphaproteobacteria bacterium]|nr:hypothetical protein [Alphaproteobacteria bacterium]
MTKPHFSALFGLSGLLALSCLTPALAMDIEFDGNLELEARSYLEDGQRTSQETAFTSVAGEFELGLYSRSGRHAVIVKPFGRVDEHDHERTHFDLREAKYRYVNGAYELTIGADKEFWGVTEFLHLVDIINQTDNVESLDGEQKLGQPMVKLSISQNWGTLTGYYMPAFRIRQFNDPLTGRHSMGFVVNDATTLFESKHGRYNPDYAIRYHNSFGVVDLGLSWFDGTARTPGFVATGQTYNDLPVLNAFYALKTQASVDVQATLGPWLLKLEATQSEQEDVTTSRATGGFEYTFYNLFGSGTDVGLVTEYMWDERELDAPHPFGNDIGLGFRWTANDTQSTAILFGGLVDLDSNSTAISLEAERRLGQNFKLILEARAQDKVGDGDLPAALNGDEDFVRLRLSWFF